MSNGNGVATTLTNAALSFSYKAKKVGGKVTKRAGKAVKAAGKAAAAAIGRRLANEFDEIRAAAKDSKAGAKA